MLNQLIIFTSAIAKIAWNFRFVVVYIIIGLVVIGRREKLEKKRMEEIIERDKLKRINNKKYSA